MAESWPSKDPDEVKDYRWEPELDAGDSISTITLTKLSGAVTVDIATPDATGITAWLSGGTAGETSVFEGRVTTAGGRTFEATFTLLVSSSAANADLSRGYVVPTVADFRRRYPGFASIPDASVAMMLDEAQTIVTTEWIEADFAPAILAYAAHKIAREGGGGSGSVGGLSGVTQFKSGSFSASFSDEAVKAQVRGGWQSTPYGQDFEIYLRRNRGGPRVTRPGRVACCGDPRIPGW